MRARASSSPSRCRRRAAPAPSLRPHTPAAPALPYAAEIRTGTTDRAFSRMAWRRVRRIVRTSVHGQRSRLTRPPSKVIDESSDVDHQHNVALADVCGTGDARNRFQPFADRLDDDFLLPHECVDEQPDGLLSGTRHDDEPLRVRTVIVIVAQAERIGEAQEGEV